MKYHFETIGEELQKMKRIIIELIVISTVFVLSMIPAFAANVHKTIEVIYRDIKIYVDGTLITPKDASGKIVEPFVYNETVYLPVRAIGEALGKTAEWDGTKNSVYIGEPNSKEITEVTVSTAEELVSALGSNKRILLNEGVYNLSSVSSNFINSSLIYYSEAYDGFELNLNGIHDLTIQGVDGAKSEIVIEPRYAYVMNFQNCSNINFNNIKVGHTEGGYCSGGVFSFMNCSGIQIDNTLMYGCGTVGLSLDGVMNMKVTGSSIYECTYGIMSVNRSKNILFEGCTFRDNKAYIMVRIALTSDFTIDKCEFLRNESIQSDPMFSVEQSDNITVKNTTFANNKAEAFIEPDSIVFDASNTYENNTFNPKS